MLWLSNVQSTAGDSSTAQAGWGSGAWRARQRVTNARQPPAESPITTTLPGGQPWASSQR
ncbi:hypothetical protein D9M69_606810 [compost metagenome]